MSTTLSATAAGYRFSVRSAFVRQCVRVSLERLVSLKVMSPTIRQTQRYTRILVSIREVGLIEPPAVIPGPEFDGTYYVLDGHLRIAALKDLGHTEVDCMVATDDDTYSYNRRVIRIGAIQEHLMIVRAAERGVSVERMAAALALQPATIRSRFRLLKGICPEAVAKLADKPCGTGIFATLRLMKPLRQLEAVELMVGQQNYSMPFVKAILVASSDEDLVTAKQRPNASGSPEVMRRLERELARLQAQNEATEESYGPDVLKLTVARGYLTALLSRERIVAWLVQRHPEYLAELRQIAEVQKGLDRASSVRDLHPVTLAP